MRHPDEMWDLVVPAGQNVSKRMSSMRSMMHSKGKSAMLQSSALLMALLVSCQAAWCAADDVKLSFPEDRNCGTLSIGPHPTLTWGWADFGEHLRSVGNRS